MEQFSVPAKMTLRNSDLDVKENSSTMFHGTRLIAATTDAELARLYLDSQEFSAHTRRATQKEIGRFLLVCRDLWQRSLRELTLEDVVHYKELLADPPALLVSSSKVPRWKRDVDPVSKEIVTVDNPAWKPFTGPLSASSRHQAILVLRAFFRFAAQAGYLQHNPAQLLKNVPVPKGARITRLLPAAAVDAVLAVIDARPPSLAQARDRFMLLLFWHTGARLDEIAQASMGDLYVEDGLTWLDVTGKGNKKRRLPIRAELVGSFFDYLATYGLTRPRTRNDSTPLILSTRRLDRQRLQAGSVYLAIKTLFRDTATVMAERGEEDLAETLRSASPHWLRHGMLSHLANAGVPLKILQETAGHASITTTERYLHVSDQQRHAALTVAMAPPDQR